MKATLCSILTLLIFLTLTSLPNNFAETETFPKNTVRIIYFVPSDRNSHQNIDAKIDELIKDIQKFYANEMERYGFGRKTFRFETDPNGKARVHHINGKFSAKYYNSEPGAFEKILVEIGDRYDTSENIGFIVADVTYPSSYWRGGGQAYLGGPSILYIPFEDLNESGEVFVSKYHAGHEIGHSFGLQHDMRRSDDFSEADIMSYRVGTALNERRLSKCAAEWLDVHPYFSPNQTSFNEPPRIQMLAPLAYPLNAINLRFNVIEPDGLHQAQLAIPTESGFSLHGCKSSNGVESAKIEFITTELTASRNEVSLGLIDVHGDFRWESFTVEVDNLDEGDGTIPDDNLVADKIWMRPGNWHGYVTRRLRDPFVVMVGDAHGEPVLGVQVFFQVISGDGTLSVTNPWTNSWGAAESYLTFGSLPGEYRVAASVSGVPYQLIFRATADASIFPDIPQKTLVGHTDEVKSIAYSPEGNTLATGSEDFTIRLWDSHTGTLLRTLRGHTGDVSSIAFSPDGLTLASGSGDDTIRLWDVATGRPKLTFRGRSYAIPSIAYSPDGDTLATGTLQGEIHLWNATTGEHKKSLTGHRREPVSNVLRLAFSPDGLTLISAGTDGTVRLWNVITGNQLKIIGPSVDEKLCDCRFSFSSDAGKVAWLGGWDLTIDLWDITVGQHEKTLVGHDAGVYAGAFSPNGQILATGSSDSEIRLWDTVTGSFRKLLIGHTGKITTLAFSPDGGTLASGSADYTIHLWEIAPTISIQVPKTLTIISGDDQQGQPGETLENPFVVEVRGEFDNPVSNVQVTFTVTAGGGTLSATSVATNSNGGAESILTLGPNPGANTVEVGVAGIQEKQTVSAIAESPRIPEDVNGDDVVNILDLVLVASDLGASGTDLSADVNRDGVVNILDLVRVAGALGNVAAAPSAWYRDLEIATTRTDVVRWLAQAQTLDLKDATAQRGVLFLEQLLAAIVPKETALLINYPNPFNPETWIPFQLAEPAEVTITIYDMNGGVVRRLEMGHQPSGIYQSRGRAVYWDGRNQRGEPVASGLYYYTLRASKFAATRKMLVRK